MSARTVQGMEREVIHWYCNYLITRSTDLVSLYPEKYENKKYMFILISERRNIGKNVY